MRRSSAALVLLVALLTVACGGSSGKTITGPPTSPTTPTPPPTTPTNRAPVITSMSASPAFGIAQLALFSMNASASDADGDTLTYTWDLGDGTQASGSSVTKTYTTQGSLVVRLTVNDGKGASLDVPTATASDTRTVVVGGMAGRWRLSTNACSPWGNGTFNLTLTQTGGRVEGSFDMPDGFCAAARGATGRTPSDAPGSIDVNGAVQIRLKLPSATFSDFIFRGTMTAPGDRVNGNLFNSGFTGESATLEKIGS